MEHNNLGDRMKSYENVNKYQLIPNSFSIIRIDGKAFHSYTKGLDLPYDLKLINDMDETAKFLCKNIQGAKLAYVQSDEISIFIEDLYDGNKKPELWFTGKIQKICSVSASLATAYFNCLRPGKLAFFDSRVFTLPNINEIYNYFYWRWLDNDRNSIQRVGQHNFSFKELHNKNCGDIINMLLINKNIDYRSTPDTVKFGRFIMYNNEKWDILIINLKTKDNILNNFFNEKYNI